MKQWRGPEYEGEFPSLGWALIDLAHAFLRVPAGHDHGKPLTLSDRQIRFIVRSYRIDPVTGRGVFRRCIDEGAKGVGKSPEGAVIGFGELVGPVVFDGWDANGEPVGRPHPTPLVQVAATAEDQTGNLYGPFRSMLAESPAIDEYRIDLGKTRIELGGRQGRMEPVTTAAGTREGQPVTCALKEETQYWKESNGGWQCDETLNRNVAKNNGRAFSFTNSYRKGGGSVAERDAISAAKGAAGILYQSIRGPFVEDLTDRDVLMAALEVAYEGAPWVDLERIADECSDPGVRPQDARRFYLNIPDDTTEDSWITREEWLGCLHPEDDIPSGSSIYVGVDVALYHDNTAVTVIHRNDAGQFVVRTKTWDPARTGEVDVADVMQYLRDLSFEFHIVEAVYDPRFFDIPAKQLADEGIPMVELPQSPSFMVPACGFAYEQIRGGRVSHDGDQILELHVLSAAMRPSESGWTLSKNKSKHVIDACIAMVMAMFRAGQPPEAVPSFMGAYL